MIEPRLNNVITLTDGAYKFLKSKTILTKHIDKLQDKHDKLHKENVKITDLLIAIDSQDKINEKNGFTLEERIKTIKKQNPEIEIDLVFRNKI